MLDKKYYLPTCLPLLQIDQNRDRSLTQQTNIFFEIINVCQRDRINYLQFPLRFENKPLKYHPFADADADVWEQLALHC